MPEEHKIKKIFEFDKIEFWLVSGDRVHSMLDSNWKNDLGEGEFIGGHRCVFKYIPENEVWISDLDKEIYSTATHEYIERLLMKEHEFNYAEAHNIALKVEDMHKKLGT